jgi:hypothetical protein
MSAKLSGKKQCAMCPKSGGIMTCDGCQQAFCGKHSVEHRQQLTNQLDGIMQEHDLIQNELHQSSKHNSLSKKIDKWEKESITKIQFAAETARADLKRLLDTPKESISKACHDIAVNLRSSRENDDFSENDLTRWMDQLKELNLEIHSPSSFKLIEDKKSVIYLITIQNSNSTNKKHVGSRELFPSSRSPMLSTHERFSQVFGPAILEKEGLLAKYIGSTGAYAHILGEQLYSQGRQGMRFQIQYSTESCDIFFGCISSIANNSIISCTSPFAVGWFGVDEVYQHGVGMSNSKKYGNNSSNIKTNDVLGLTFNCEKQQLELVHERSNNTYTLQVDIDKAPFPWQLLLVLINVNDCVRILL